MKIAYLVFAYRNQHLIRRTIERLSCSECAFFVHIDAKIDIDRFASIHGKNVFFTDKRIPVFWAEFSGIEAILILIRQALAAAEPYDYLLLLSGSEYPLRSKDYIHQFLEANRGMEYMTLVSVPNEQAGKPISRITTLMYPSRRPLFRFGFQILAKLGLATRDYRKYFGNMKPYSGATWWALSREACRYIVDFERQNRQLATFFENAFAPEETFFHTILGNSPFKARMRRNLLFEDWSTPGGHPAMINEGHLAFFEAQDRVCVEDMHGPGELLFARKFSDENLQLVQRVDKMIAQKEGQNTAG